MDEHDIYKVFGEIGKLHHYSTYKTFEEYGIYPGQPPLLMLLYRKGGLSQKEIATHLFIKPATVNVTIKRMENSGFVRREQDKNDQRISRVFLTEKGKIVSKKIWKIHKDQSKKCFENFTEDELDLFYNLLCKIRDSIKNEGGR